jgi:hypothetical protein
MPKIESRAETAPTFPLIPAEQKEPLFHATHGALMFAFNFVHGSLKKSTLAQLLPPGRPGRGLSGLDGAAQAGMIKAEVDELQAAHKSMIAARFAPANSPCACRSSCCSGYRENREWQEAVHWLAEYTLSEGLTGTISHVRIRRALVTKYFGVRTSLVEIAMACGVNRDTVSANNMRVVDRFKKLERHATEAIDERLVRAGIIEPPTPCS